jgi:hypothetical protein
VDADLAGTVVPYLVATAGYYGSAVLQHLEESTADSAVDATVSLGRRLLGRLIGRPHSQPAIEAAVTDLAADPADADFAAALRVLIRKALAADPELATDLTGLLDTAGVSIVASGDRAVAAQDISGNVTTGDSSPIQR